MVEWRNSGYYDKRTLARGVSLTFNFDVRAVIESGTCVIHGHIRPSLVYFLARFLALASDFLGSTQMDSMPHSCPTHGLGSVRLG